MNEKKVISAFIKSMMSEMADGPDAPERLRADLRGDVRVGGVGGVR